MHWPIAWILTAYLHMPLRLLSQPRPSSQPITGSMSSMLEPRRTASQVRSAYPAEQERPSSLLAPPPRRLPQMRPATTASADWRTAATRLHPRRGYTRLALAHNQLL